MPQIKAVRKLEVPENLIGKGLGEIQDWARSELHGQEADLDKQTVKDIQAGKMRQVILRPRKKGFYLPDGTFVEAFEYGISVGDDLNIAEKAWEREEKERTWADNENTIFREKLNSTSPELSNFVYFEHGKRIGKGSKQLKKSPSYLFGLLAKRDRHKKGTPGFHEFCYQLYLWKQKAAKNDAAFGFPDRALFGIIRFSRDSEVRDSVVQCINEVFLKRGMEWKTIEDFLDDKIIGLKGLRQKLRNREQIEDADLTLFPSARF